MEVYKTIVEINPKCMWIYFLKNLVSYDLKKGDKVFLPPARSVRMELIHVSSEAVLLGIAFPRQPKNVKHLSSLNLY